MCGVCGVSEKHTGWLQVAQAHSQLQRGAPPRIQALDILLRNRIRRAASAQCKVTLPTHLGKIKNPPSTSCKTLRLTSFLCSSRSSSRYWLFQTRKCKGNASCAILVRLTTEQFNGYDCNWTSAANRLQWHHRLCTNALVSKLVLLATTKGGY